MDQHSRLDWEPHLSQHAHKNRAAWEAASDRYQEAKQFDPDTAMAWGEDRIAEAKLQVLGDVQGKDVLELGCGAARWSIALSQRGARPVGLDVSPRQLWHAARVMREVGVDFPLIEATAEAVPLPDRSFDIVFCDYGAMSFCDPYLTIPEAGRLLRPGGLLAFLTASPLLYVCYDEQSDEVGTALLHDYFGLWKAEFETVDFVLPYGEWIRLFRRHGFLIEDLIELQSPESSEVSQSEWLPRSWTRRWPARIIWRIRNQQ
jgi:ubiquinone/menaquinone biosynthesis C-methylase UbiE